MWSKMAVSVRAGWLMIEDEVYQKDNPKNTISTVNWYGDLVKTSVKKREAEMSVNVPTRCKRWNG